MGVDSALYPCYLFTQKATSPYSIKMAMWADNLKFVKDILDGKYKKIDDAIAELNDNAEVLTKEPDAAKPKEMFLGAGRTLELMEPKEIEQLLETIVDEHMPASPLTLLRFGHHHLAELVKVHGS